MAVAAGLPTLYEYYTGGGITAGLSVDKPYFTLNEKNITLYSGAMHYFRVPREYWRDRLRKMRAAGLNAVETYVPWNLHEPQNGTYDFGNGGSEMQDFLDIREYLKIVQEEDLLAIVRSGPFISAEWEFGGFPSWLLREKSIKFRTSDATYMQYVKRYFSTLLPILALFQFTNGGSIVAFQVENEYGNTGIRDKNYLLQLRDIMLENGIKELLCTSDGILSHGDTGTIPGVLFATANLQSYIKEQFDALKEFQPDKPFMAMEYWTGWFDNWSEAHHTQSNDRFKDILEQILTYPASVNMYMFHGGTSWGFTNGATSGVPDTSSYDYDAPLTESGDYTAKYQSAKDMIRNYNPVNTTLPEAPTETPRTAYPTIAVSEHLPFNDVIDQIPEKFSMSEVTPMELLPINNNSGQSYGYVLYRKEHINIAARAVLTIEGSVSDTVVVMVNGVLMSPSLTQASDLDGFGYWRLKDSKLTLGALRNVTDATLDLVVENWGRATTGYTNQFKGLWQGSVYVNNDKVSGWQIVPIEFKKQWTNGLQGWSEMPTQRLSGPALYRASFEVQEPQDTFLDMREWTKGIVMVNGFVLGRYAKIGPQQTLYLPAPFIRQGHNDIVIFEHFAASDKIVFARDRIYSTP